MSTPQQPRLFEIEPSPAQTDPHLAEVVNVASVPKRSPFRYPGGKTWLVPRARCWLGARGGRGKELIEPFTGGGIVGLTAGFENYVDLVTFVELDENVASVWQTILSDDAVWLTDRIMEFDPTPDTVHEVVARAHLSTPDRAFATIVRNRVNRGGILADGAGLIKFGEGGKGLRSRWYPGTLKRRILEIHQIRHKFRFVQGDALDVMAANAERSNAIYFIDPPYVVAGHRLYQQYEIDHARLFDVTATLAGDFLMTYDNAEYIRSLATAHDFDMAAVAMKSTHHELKRELLISRKIDWLPD